MLRAALVLALVLTMSTSVPFLFRWRDAVCSSAGPPSTTRLVLLTLSLDADTDGGSCYPSTRRLATRSGLSRRVIMKHLAGAEADGWVRRHVLGTDKGKGWKRHRYELRIPLHAVTEGDHDTDMVVNEGDQEGGDAESPRTEEGGDPHAQGGDPERTKVVTEGDHTSPYTSPKTSPSPPEGEAVASTPEGEAVEGETTTTDTMAANELVAAWIDLRGDRPPNAVVKKQGAAAKRLVEKYTRTQIERALDGIGRLFPHSDGQPWDLMTLDKKFGLALDAPAAGNGRSGRPTDIDHDDIDAWDT